MRALTKNQFRAVLVLSYGFSALSIAAAFLGESSLPPPLQEYLGFDENAEFSAMDAVILAVVLPFLVVELVSLVALLRFWRWSRELAIAVTVAGVVMIPFLGPTVEPGVATSLSFTSSMLYGAVLALAYFSPAAEWFPSRQAAEPPYPVGGAAMGGMS